VVGDGAHPIRIRDRGATELLNDESHGRAGYRVHLEALQRNREVETDVRPIPRAEV
jgi:hypothetical protein